MAHYSYKDVAYDIPEHVTEKFKTEYGREPDGDPNYNGDCWTLAAMWIEELQQAAKAQAVPQWISVSERLPEHKDGMCSDPVIAMSDTGDVFRLSYCGGWQRTSSFMDSGSSNVTHWMPLPAAPEQNK